MKLHNADVRLRRREGGASLQQTCHFSFFFFKSRKTGGGAKSQMHLEKECVLKHARRKNNETKSAEIFCLLNH